MQFNPSIGSQGITNDVWFLTGTDSTSFPLADLARIINKVSHKLGLLAWKSSSSWKFDDSSKTDMAISTTTLVDDQEDYSLPTTTFDILRVEIKDSNGNWSKLSYRTRESVSGAMDEYQETKDIPTEYFLEGCSIRLKPAPDTTKVTASAGLKIGIARDVTEFVSTDTTKTPGFPTPFHQLFSHEIALEYASINGLTDKIEYLAAKVGAGERDFVDYYANRGGEIKTKLTTKSIDYE